MKYRDRYTKREYTEEELNNYMVDCIGECELWDMIKNYSFDTIWYNLKEEFRQEVWDLAIDFYKNRWYEVIEEDKE